MRYRPEIDGLRACALVPVVLFHAGFEFFSGGFIGVDIFFVISGYLITSIILNELADDTFSIVNFYERRARRILPALFFMMAVCLPLAWIWLPPIEMKDFAKSVIAVCLFSSNILFFKQSGYFDGPAELKPLLHTWSLAVEEQFYLLFPLILLATKALGNRRITILLISIAISSLAAAQWAAYMAPRAGFFLLPMRWWELAIGSFVAIYFTFQSKPLTKPIINQLASSTGLAMIFYSAVTFDKHTPFPSLYGLLPTLGTALVIIYATPRTLVGWLLSRRLLTGIGLISYSAYLWHQPLFAFTRLALPTAPNINNYVALCLLTLILAYLSWRYIEQPFRQKARFNRQTIFTYAGALSMAFLAFGMSGSFSDGFKNLRLNDKQLEILETASRSPKRKECHTEDTDYRHPVDACEYFYADPEWAVLGNSFGVELAYALAEKLKPYHQGVKHLTFSGCRPSFDNDVDIASPGCWNWTQEAINYLLTSKKIKNIVISYHMYGLKNIDLANTDTILDPEVELKRWQPYLALVQRLVDANKQVFFVLQAPQQEKRISYYILANHSDFDFIPGISKRRWDISSESVRYLTANLPKSVHIVDIANLFCNTDTCAVIKDDKALYYDSYHISINGGLLVADQIIKLTALNKSGLKADNDNS